MGRIIKLVFSIIVIFTSILIFNRYDANAKTSYMLSKNNIYTYEFKFTDEDSQEFNSTFTDKYIKKVNGYLVFSHNYDAYKETKNGLFHSFCTDAPEAPPCSVETKPLKEISYPIKVGKTWGYIDTYKKKIIATNLTVKTKAGTFKHVIKVRLYQSANLGYEDWYDEYYAPNVGLVRTENIFEQESHWMKDLIKLKKIKKH
ncbi:hypothetical protein [Rummeliibacillus pycnus]|uniref:hypothetical protein n=1 Tax=Rummeliibacillus pycnus TaxID=101070 RepID=UPI003D29DEEB